VKKIRKNVCIALISSVILILMVSTTSTGLTNVNGQSDSIFQGKKDNIVTDYDAKEVSINKKLTVDPDAKNMIIMIPNKALTSDPFLPIYAEIPKGTKVIWFNGDESNHGVVVHNPRGDEILTNSSIPYKNATSFVFVNNGKYQFYDPTNPSIKGSINVVDPSTSPQYLSTNETTMTVGVFLAPPINEEWFDEHMNTIGYNIVSKYPFKQQQPVSFESTQNYNDDKTLLYVYTQKSGKYDTILARLALKTEILKDFMSGKKN
jgi:plastocyanin